MRRSESCPADTAPSGTAIDLAAFFREELLEDGAEEVAASLGVVARGVVLEFRPHRGDFQASIEVGEGCALGLLDAEGEAIEALLAAAGFGAQLGFGLGAEAFDPR